MLEKVTNFRYLELSSHTCQQSETLPKYCTRIYLIIPGCFWKPDFLTVVFIHVFIAIPPKLKLNFFLLIINYSEVQTNYVTSSKWIKLLNYHRLHAGNIFVLKVWFSKRCWKKSTNKLSQGSTVNDVTALGGSRILWWQYKSLENKKRL